MRKQLASDPGLLEGLAHGGALECLRGVLSALGEEVLLRCAVEDEQDFLGGGVYSNRATADDELGREVEGLPGWHRFGGGERFSIGEIIILCYAWNISQ